MDDNKPIFQRQYPFRDRQLPPSLAGKWEDRVMEEGFVAFPKKLLRTIAKILPANETEMLAIILALVDFKRQGAYRTNPSLDFLQFTTGLEKQKILIHLDDMREAKLLKYKIIRDENESDSVEADLYHFNAMIEIES